MFRQGSPFGFSGGPFGFAPARRQGLLAKVGSFTSPTATGVKAITGTGFRPKVLIPFGTTPVNVTGSNDQGATLGFGVGTDIVQAAVGLSSRNGVTTTDTRRSHYRKVLRPELIQGTIPAVTASLESLDADGFTLDFEVVSGAQRVYNYACLGGAIEANLVECRMNTDNSPQSIGHGLDGEPSAILLFSVLNEQAPDVSRSSMYGSLGMWAGGNQASASVFSNNGVTTTDTRRLLSTTKALVRIDTSVKRSIAISSVDATNVNFTYPDTTLLNEMYFWMLCIRNCKAQVGTYDCLDSLDPLAIPCPGIRPKLFLAANMYSGLPADTIRASVFLSIGASDGTKTASAGITDRTNLTTASARRYTDLDSFVEYSDSADLRFDAAVSFDGESVVVDPSVIGATADYGHGIYLTLGD